MGRKKRRSVEDKGHKYVSWNPGWIGSYPRSAGYKDNLSHILDFYVLNTPCTTLSYQGKDLSLYGWNPDTIWRQEKIVKRQLKAVAGLKSGISFFPIPSLDKTKNVLSQAKLNSEFPKLRDEEKLAFYLVSKYPQQFMSIFYHIRNALAHGRFSVYENQGVYVYVLESGVKKETEFQVRARFILRESTLLAWKRILEKGPVRVG